MNTKNKKTACKFGAYATNSLRPLVRHCLKTLFLVLLLVGATGCENLRLIGQGIDNASERASRAIACVSVGLYPCMALSAVSGYAEGKEETRETIKDEKELKRALDQPADDGLFGFGILGL